MSYHARRQIREAFKTRLTGLTTTGSNVFNGRVFPINDSELEALNIYTDEEEVDFEATPFETFYSRKLVVTVEAFAKAEKEVNNVCDLMAAEIETAVETDPTFSGILSACDLAGTTIQRLGTEAEQEAGMVRLEYIVSYLTAKNDPTVILIV